MKFSSRFYTLTVVLLVVFLYACTKEAEPEFIEENGYHSIYRPQIHFSSKYNWLNDPNGMVYHDGEYHLFYQHNPYGATWGHMSWGHAVSKDLIHWQQLNVALEPDDLGDIFSGSAVIDKNNTAGFGHNAMVAIYTSAGKNQTQSIAYSTDNGRTFTKYSANPVLTDLGRHDFRDPKVFWYEATNEWIMSLATGQSISFYKSPNLKEWSKLSEFGSGIGAHGGTWECPDLFPMRFENETKWVLLVSLMPGAPNGGSGTQYFIGHFNGVNFIADPAPYPLWFDYGKDNYAGVTWDNIPNNRRIQMAWMNNWEYANEIPAYSFKGIPARSCMTLPRELSLVKDDAGGLRLNHTVISEINDIGLAWKSLFNSNLGSENNTFVLPDKPKAYHLQLTTTLLENQMLTLSLHNDFNNKTDIIIHAGENRIIFDRTKSGNVSFASRFPGVYSCPLDYKVNKPTTLDIYVDQSSVEIVLNAGDRSMTNMVFPQRNYDKVSLSLNTGSSNSSLNYRSFKGIW